MNIRFVEDGPVDTAALLDLYQAVGWLSYLEIDREILEKSIDRADHTVQAILEGQLVGFGRSLSDGVLYVVLQDVIVDPRFQRKGIGSEVIKRILRFYSRLPRQDYIRLFAEPGSEGFYRFLRFEECPLTGFQLTSVK